MTCKDKAPYDPTPPCKTCVTHMNESCHTCEWVMSHIWMSHVTHVNESCHACEWITYTYAWVKSHMGMSHVTHMNASRYTRGWVTSHIWMRHMSHTNESYHELKVWSHGREKKTLARVMSHIGMSESCHTWMSHFTHMNVNKSCHTYKWVIAHLWMSHVTHMDESCHTYEGVMSHTWMSHVSLVNMRRLRLNVNGLAQYACLE